MQKETIYQLPDEWKWESLSKVSFIEDHLRKPVNSIERQRRVADKQDHELYPYYGATGQVGYIDSYLTDGNYILIGEDGAPFLDPFKAKAYEIKGKTWVNNHAHILRASNFFSPKFLLYYLNQFDYKDFVSGTTRLKLTKSSLLNIPVPVPPLGEQNRIVERIEELFSEFDNGVAKLKEIQKQLDIYQQTLLKHSFQKKGKEANFYSLKDICTII